MPQRELFILDVGHGNCTLLTDEKGVIVIDAGPGTSLLEFIKKEEIKRIDVILISHSDADHIAGVVAVLNSNIVEIGKIRLNSDALQKSKLWDDLLSSLADYDDQGRLDFNVGLTVKNTDEFNQGDIKVEILAPNLYIAAKSAGAKDKSGRLLTTNSNSVVIRLSLNGYPIILLPADVDSVGFNNLIEDGNDCEAAIVVFPHHGGNAGTGDTVEFTEEFCRRTNPRVVVFSLGRGKHNTPKPEIIETIHKILPDALIICTQLSEHCAADIPITEKKHLSSKYASGKRKDHCCAGTIAIDLDKIEEFITTSTVMHQDFITDFIPNALCRLKV